MDKTNTNIKALAIVSYIMAILAVVYDSSLIVPMMLAVGMIALFIVAMFATKDSTDEKATLPLLGPVVLFFGRMLVSVVFTLLMRVVNKIQNWTLDSWDKQGEEAAAKGRYETAQALAEKIQKLQEAMEKDVLGDVLRVILFIVTVGVIVLALLAILNLLANKEHEKTPAGKIAGILYSKKASAKRASGNAWFCPQCGAQSTGEFCAKCGTKKP